MSLEGVPCVRWAPRGAELPLRARPEALALSRRFLPEEQARGWAGQADGLHIQAASLVRGAG